MDRGRKRRRRLGNCRVRCGEAGGIVDDASQDTPTVAEHGANEEEEQSEISSADASKTPHKHHGPRFCRPRALVRARIAAMEMAAQAEGEVVQDLAIGSMAESTATLDEHEGSESVMACQQRINLLVKA